MVDDLAGDLVADDARGGEGELALEDVEVGVADPAGLGADEDLPGLGAGDLEELQGEGAGGVPEHRPLHRRRRADVVPGGGGGGGGGVASPADLRIGAGGFKDGMMR